MCSTWPRAPRPWRGTARPSTRAPAGFLLVLLLSLTSTNLRAQEAPWSLSALLAGLVIVNTHNLWVADWPVIITIFGWLAVVGGIIRIALPDTVKSIAEAMLARDAVLRVVAVLQVALGAYLMMKGYL